MVGQAYNGHSCSKAGWERRAQEPKQAQHLVGKKFPILKLKNIILGRSSLRPIRQLPSVNSGAAPPPGSQDIQACWGGPVGMAVLSVGNHPGAILPFSCRMSVFWDSLPVIPSENLQFNNLLPCVSFWSLRTGWLTRTHDPHSSSRDCLAVPMMLSLECSSSYFKMTENFPDLFTFWFLYANIFFFSFSLTFTTSNKEIESHLEPFA